MLSLTSGVASAVLHALRVTFRHTGCVTHCAPSDHVHHTLRHEPLHTPTKLHTENITPNVVTSNWGASRVVAQHKAEFFVASLNEAVNAASNDMRPVHEPLHPPTPQPNLSAFSVQQSLRKQNYPSTHRTQQVMCTEGTYCPDSTTLCMRWTLREITPRPINPHDGPRTQQPRGPESSIIPH